MQITPVGDRRKRALRSKKHSRKYYTLLKLKRRSMNADIEDMSFQRCFFRTAWGHDRLACCCDVSDATAKGFILCAKDHLIFWFRSCARLHCTHVMEGSKYEYLTIRYPGVRRIIADAFKLLTPKKKKDEHRSVFYCLEWSSWLTESRPFSSVHSLKYSSRLTAPGNTSVISASSISLQFSKLVMYNLFS